MTNKWHQIHDFLHGFGYLKEDETGTKRIFLNDLHRFKEDYYFYEDFSDEILDELYVKIQDLKAEWAKNNPRPDVKCNEFKSISLPKINRPYPRLDNIVNVQPMTEPKALMKSLKMKQTELKEWKEEQK
jgi:hypothetical protein